MRNAMRYIRFGKIPAGGKSFNSMDRRFEAGISCYRLVRCGRTWLIDGAYGSYRMLRASGRPLYEIAGTEIGTGADGEPLLADAHIVRRIRDARWQDVWQRINALPSPQYADCDRIYQHAISGAVRVWLAGVIDLECPALEFESNLRLFLRHEPQRAEQILSTTRLIDA